MMAVLTDEQELRAARPADIAPLNGNGDGDAPTDGSLAEDNERRRRS